LEKNKKRGRKNENKKINREKEENATVSCGRTNYSFFSDVQLANCGPVNDSPTNLF